MLCVVLGLCRSSTLPTTGTSGERYRLRNLVREYAHPIPAAASDETLTQLRGMLRKLDDAAAGALVQRLVARAAAVQGGREAVKAHLARIEVCCVVVCRWWCMVCVPCMVCVRMMRF